MPDLNQCHARSLRLSSSNSMLDGMVGVQPIGAKLNSCSQPRSNLRRERLALM